MAKIHPTAIVDPSAKLADDVEVGPYCVIEHDTEIGQGTRLIAQCHIGAYATLGANNVVYPFALPSGPIRRITVSRAGFPIRKSGTTTGFARGSR